MKRLAVVLAWLIAAPLSAAPLAMPPVFSLTLRPTTSPIRLYLRTPLLDIVSSGGVVTAGGGGGSALSGLTSGRVLFATGSSTAGGDADMTFSVDTLTITKILGTGLVTFGSAVDAANTVRFNETAGAIVGEGPTADANETTLAFGDATADNTLTVTGTATGVTLAAATGSTQFADNKILVCGSADFTKCAAFEVDGLTTGTTRTFTFPNLAGTTVLTTGTASTGQTMVGALAAPASAGNAEGLYLGGYSASFQGMVWNTTQTPDTAMYLTGSTSNHAVIAEGADVGTDFAHPIAINPWWFWQSRNTVVSEYHGIGAAGDWSGLFKTLTESSATAVVQIPVASGSAAGGIFEYGVFATDGTDHQLRESSIRYSVVNKAGTETCSLSALAGTNDASITELEDGNANAISSGTLTYAIACDTSPTNAVNITINAVSSLTQTTLQARYQVRHLGPSTSEPLPQ